MDVPITAKAALLQVLLDGPGYGIELAERISTRTNEAVTLLQGSLYPALKSLEEAQLVTSYEAEQPKERNGGTRMRAHYKLTAAGKKLAQAHRTAMLGLVGAAVPEPEKVKKAKTKKEPELPAESVA